MAPHTSTKRATATDADEMLSTEAAAARVGLSPITLKIWRWRRNPHAPPHTTVGSRTIRYSAAAIAQWLATRTHKPGTKARRHRRSS